MSRPEQTGDRVAGPVQIPIAWSGAIGGERQDLDLRMGCGGRDWMSRPEQTGDRAAGPVQIVIERIGARGRARHPDRGGTEGYGYPQEALTPKLITRVFGWGPRWNGD
jgi:hypothetical protein